MSFRHIINIFHSYLCTQYQIPLSHTISNKSSNCSSAFTQTLDTKVHLSNVFCSENTENRHCKRNKYLGKVTTSYNEAIWFPEK